MLQLKNMQYGQEIITYLNHIKSEIELYNSFKLYNINKFAEYFYAEFLNLVCGYELEIMEIINPNMVAIDLGDEKNKIAIQVTSNTTLEKIRETHEKYLENKLDKIYDKLIVLYIAKESPKHSKRTKFIEENNIEIWDIEHLINETLPKKIDKLKDIHDLLKKYVEDSPQIPNLDTFLKERYKSKNFTKLKSLSLNNASIQDVYQDLSILKKIKNDENKEEYIDKILDDFQKVAILGKSGVGKSTLAKYICYQWAEDKLFNNYEYLFYIPIKKWEKGEGVFDVVLKVIKESINEDIKINADDLYDYIQESFNDKALFVIDGLDEIGVENKEHIEEEVRNFNNYIITSRHNGLEENEFDIEEVFENRGFNQNSVENFIKYISNNDELKRQINNNTQLRELSQIPMLLDMISYLYQEDLLDFNSNDFTITSLYKNFHDEIIRRLEKERSSNYKEINNMDNNFFLKLGEIAFENLKNRKFKFKGSFIDDVFIEHQLLSSDYIVSLTNKGHPKNREYEFIHTSFQEYFSALYVAELYKKKKGKKKVKKIIKKWKFYPHMQMFFAFLGGLIRDKGFLLREIESEPKDLVGYYELFLIIDCLNEIKNYDSKLYIDKTLQLLKYSMEQENLYENLFKPILHKIQNYKYFHTKHVYEAIYNIILESSNPSSFPFHNLIVAMIENLAYLLPIIIDNENKIIEKYSEIVQNEKLSMYIKNMMARGFSLPITNTIDKTLIKIIKRENENENYRFWMCKALIYSNSNDIEKVDIISTFLEKNIEKIDNNIFYLLFNTISIGDEIREKEKLIKGLENILNIYSNSNNFNLFNLKNDINNIKSSLQKNKYQRKSRFQEYNLSKQIVYLLVKKEKFKTEYTEEEYIDDLIYIANNSSFNIYLHRRDAFVTLESLGRVDDKILTLAIDYLNSEEHDLKGEANRLFYSINREDDKYINILQNAINRYEDSRVKLTILNKLFTLKRKDEKYIDILRNFSLVSPEIFHKSILSKSLEGFEKIFNNEKILPIYKEKYLSINLDIKVLFKAYDKKYNIEKILLSNLIYSNKPLYIKKDKKDKKKKLHTIENGKEISTKREVDEKFLNELEILLKGDGLDA